MNQPKSKSPWANGEWPAENSVEDAEIAKMAAKNAITQFNITEHESNTFYVTLHFNWRPELVHLATRRTKDEPRMFKDLSRLIAHIKEKYPHVRNINLILNRRREQLPVEDDARGTGLPAKPKKKKPVPKVPAKKATKA